MRLIRTIFAALLMLTASSMLAGTGLGLAVGLDHLAGPAMAQGGCLSQSAQRQAIQSGDAVRPGAIGQRLGGKVLRLSLCEGAGGLTWRVTVLQGDGRVVEREVDARSGRPLR
ncbi:PepSY domain-containing protein [Acuticoccus yangtzensis]|uniref:PepSY domain-containing protein n=1 Tax=Acuticoccus yangtzensis TaxID=1443441 RepID=UPI000B16B655|nr:PepSY domain-containing protein [Acuticoccus yangtzensis]